MVAVAAIELQNNELIARNEQLGRELGKIKTVTKGKQKPLVLTIKQYQAFVGHLSDMHRAMVVTAMCSGLRVSEVLALKWDQLDFANGGRSRLRGSMDRSPWTLFWWKAYWNGATKLTEPA